MSFAGKCNGLIVPSELHPVIRSSATLVRKKPAAQIRPCHVLLNHVNRRRHASGAANGWLARKGRQGLGNPSMDPTGCRRPFTLP
jgi:hypothetical protein